MRKVIQSVVILVNTFTDSSATMQRDIRLTIQSLTKMTQTTMMMNMQKYATA